MLDEGDHPAGHEAAAANRASCPGDLGDLDHPTAGRDLEAPARTRGHDLEALHAPVPASTRTSTRSPFIAARMLPPPDQLDGRLTPGESDVELCGSKRP